MHRILSAATVLAAASLLCGSANASAQVLTVADRAPRFYLASADGVTRRDASGLPVLRRRVSLSLDHVPLAEALQMISDRANLRLFYSPDVLPERIRVSLSAKDITVTAALTEILLDTGLDVVISTSRKMTLVERNPKPVVTLTGAIVGRLTDAKTGLGISTAEVFLEGTHWRTTSDSSGRYRLTEIDTGSYTLTARRLGYAKTGQRVTVRDGKADTLNLMMEPVATRLNELVATATGRQRRRDIGNAITTIDADSILRAAPIKNLTDLLENRVPGLTVQHTTGAPGDPARLRLRGLGSALRSNDPVVIVDGMRIYAAQADARSGNLTNLAPTLSGQAAGSVMGSYAPSPAPSPLDQIDPNIIEKIEVFKGPSAATLYGADAANGVIVITTKRGRPGPTRWNASFTRGREMPAGAYPPAYFRWGHDTVSVVHTNDEVGTPYVCTLAQPFCVQDSLVQFQALNNTAFTPFGHGHSTGLSLTASGGTQAVTYSVTGSYTNTVGLLQLPAYELARFQTRFLREPPDWMKRPQQYTIWNMNSAVQAHLGAKADISLTMMLSRSDQRRSNLENSLAALQGVYVDTTLGFYYVPTKDFSLDGSNSVLGLTLAPDFLTTYYTKRTSSTITVTTGLQAQWHPRSWLSTSGQASLNIVPRDDRLFLPGGFVNPTDSGATSLGTGRSLVSTVNLQGKLRKPLGRGFIFETSLGANLVTTTTNDVAVSGAGLVPGTTSLTGATRLGLTQLGSNSSVYGWYIEPRVAGQRLALSTGLRLDGGSAYGVRLTRSGGNGGFLKNLLSLPKLNGSWVISEEPWFPFRGLFTSLRLLGSYGQAQVQPSPTDRLRLYTGTTDQPNSVLTLTTLGNTALRPERSTEFEGGVESEFWDGRFTLEFTGYRKLQVDALQPVILPPSVNGGGPVLTNIGNIRNTGADVTLGMTPLRRSGLTWRVNVIYNRNTNQVTKLGEGVGENKSAGLVEGYPLHSRWARPILGYADQNGDGVLQAGEIQVGDSLVYMGRLYPVSTTTVSTDLVLFGGAVGVTADFRYEGGQTQIDQTLQDNWVMVRAVSDPTAPFIEQAAVWATTRRTDPTDYGLMREVRTLRFKSLSVRYRAPVRAARLIGAQQLAVALQGDNLGLHSSTYGGKDPNVNTWNAGEGIIDTGQLARPRTWQLRLDLQF